MRFLPLVTVSLASAGLSLLFDPQAGHRRRAQLRDKSRKLVRGLRRGADVAARDLAHRATGVAAETRAILRERQVADDLLLRRVAARLGHVCSHPRAIHCGADDGVVTLSGDVLGSEAERVLRAVKAVRGVKRVESRLNSHDTSENVPTLQGPERARMRGRFNFQQINWTPATRCGAALVGSALISNAARNRTNTGISGKALRLGATAIGTGLVARAVTNLPLSRLTGIGAGRRAIETNKAISVNCPPSRAFDYWSQLTNFPYFMTNVREVQDLGDGRSRWHVRGPAGMDVSWDAITTRVQENELIAWRSEPGALVQHAGVVRFLPNDDNTTTIDVRLAYNPPAGAFGHGLLALLGQAPKHKLDVDLMRLKGFLETGTPARDAAKRSHVHRGDHHLADDEPRLLH